jgi:hypothetical protein
VVNILFDFYRTPKSELNMLWCKTLSLASWIFNINFNIIFPSKRRSQTSSLPAKSPSLHFVRFYCMLMPVTGSVISLTEISHVTSISYVNCANYQYSFRK